MDKYIVAFEIGSSKVRGAVGIVDDSGIVEVIGIKDERIHGSVRYGSIENMDVAAAMTSVASSLEASPRLSPHKITGAYVGVGARSLMSRQVDVQIALPEEMEISADVIDELRKKAASTETSERDVIDVVPVRFTVDKRQVVNPVGACGQTVGAKMTVVSCMPGVKRMLRRVISERMGLDIAGFVCRPLAEGATVLTEDERRLGCMLVDFGAETTTVAIYKNGVCQYVATLPIGSRNITLDLTALNFIEERAEELKKVSGNAMAGEQGPYGPSHDGIDYTEMNHYVHARCGEIIANIMAQVDYAGMKVSDLVSGIVIIGGGSQLHGFNDLLDKQSGMKVRQGSAQGALRITEGSIRNSDNIDVISVLMAAARSGADTPCIDIIEQQEGPVEAPTYENMYGSTVGVGNPNNPSGPKHASDNSRRGDNKPAAPDDDDEDDLPEDPDARPRRNSFFERLKNKISNMVRDDEERGDEFLS